RPSLLGCTGMVSVPSGDNWAGWYITQWYQNWQNGVWGKYGMMLNPQYNNNNFDFVRSSRYAGNDYLPTTGDADRPILQFDFTPPVSVPNFKMPLPQNISWLVTT